MPLLSPIFPQSDLAKLTMAQRQALALQILKVLQSDPEVKALIRAKIAPQLDQPTRTQLRVQPF